VNASLATLDSPAFVPSRPTVPGRLRRLMAWLNRPRRILLALLLVWIIATFDLLFTLTEWGTPGFIEMNPVAVKVIHGSVDYLFFFKFGLLGLSSLILLALRRHRITELGSWFLLAVMLYLSIRWFTYYGYIDEHDASPIVEVVAESGLRIPAQ
jgi:hypothetical protein